MAFLDYDGLSVVLSNLKTKFTALFAAKSHSHAYSELTGKPTIDSELSNTSTNAVQNKVIYTELGKKSNVADIKDNLTSSDTDKPLSAAQGKALKTAIDSITGEIGELGGGDMMKATYDANGNGVVDNAEKLGGQAPSYYATAADLAEKVLWVTFEINQLGNNVSCSKTIDEIQTALGGGAVFAALTSAYNHHFSDGTAYEVNGAILPCAVNVSGASTYDIRFQGVFPGTGDRFATLTIQYDDTHSRWSFSHSETAYKVSQLTNDSDFQTAAQVTSKINTALSSVITYGGSIPASSLAGLAVEANSHKMYNVTEKFTTTSAFKEGAGKSYPAGTNVVVVPNGAGTGFLIDVYTGVFEVAALTTTEINSAFTAAGY